MNERKPSCDVISGFEPEVVEASCYDTLKGELAKPLLTTEGKEVPADKLKAMQDYAKILRKKFPHMKESRVSRKVAEHFKIKLV